MPAPEPATDRLTNNVLRETPRGAPTGLAAGRLEAFRGDDFSRDVWCVFGLPIDMVDVAGAVRAVESAARTRRRLAFVTPNVNMLCAAAADPAVRADIIDNDLSLADGAPVAALARLVGAPLKGRCAGADVFEALRRRPGFEGRRLRAFFFGGRDGAAQAAHTALNKERGGVESVGFDNPGHGDIESMSAQAVIDKINAAEPDFVVVALGAAKGNAWIARNAERLTAPAVSHLGAVVDFTAGGVKRAPAAVSRIGLEWAWRILQDNALWRRYARDAIALARLIATRAAPSRLLRPRSSGAQTRVTVETIHGQVSQVCVRLAGDLTIDARDAVRAAFRRAAAERGDIVLSFDADGALDAAFLGQVLMLERAALRGGRRLIAAGLGPARRRWMKLNGVRFDDIVDDAAAAATGRDAAIAGVAQTA